jgi:ABC-type multidrug transport system fused ATPase/permease subunit
VRGAAQLAFSLALMLSTSWRLTLVVVATVPAVAVAVARYGRAVRRLSTQWVGGGGPARDQRR